MRVWLATDGYYTRLGSVCRVVRRSARNVPSLGWAVLYLSIYLSPVAVPEEPQLQRFFALVAPLISTSSSLGCDSSIARPTGAQSSQLSQQTNAANLLRAYLLRGSDVQVSYFVSWTTTLRSIRAASVRRKTTTGGRKQRAWVRASPFVLVLGLAFIS